MSRVRAFLFGERSLLVQAYVWFAISLVGVATFVLLPERWRVIVIGWLSWLALTLTAQNFIAAAQANRKLLEAEEREAERAKGD